MKKNDVIRGVCIDYTYEGLGIVKVDGFPFFIKQIMMNEEVEFIITKLNSRFGYGKCINVITPSPERVMPFCEYYGKCGGCQLQHMSEAAQLSFKKGIVENNMKNIAKCDALILDVIRSEDTQYYRNKAQFPVRIEDGEVAMGFYRIHSNDIIDMNDCKVQCQVINDVMRTTKQLLEEGNFKNYFRHVLIKYGFHTKEAMVVFVTKRKIVEGLASLVENLHKAHPEIKSIVQNINKRSDNVILGEDEILLYGKESIRDHIQDLKFDIAAKSFYQVNPKQTLKLYECALQFAQITKEDVVLDLYCGVGTISMFLAKQAKAVIGIEIVEEAIANAKHNAVLNDIQNISFVCSDAAHYAKQLAAEQKTIDVVVVDPPRKGCDLITIESIQFMQPKRIVYVSCNPATLARDIALFNERGYHCEKIQSVDMFPSSYHVESVVLMSRK